MHTVIALEVINIVLFFSPESKEPMLVIIHQMLCEYFSLRLTAAMKEQNASMNSLKYTSISHEVKCYRSTKIFPASVEEHTCIYSASLY